MTKVSVAGKTLADFPDLVKALDDFIKWSDYFFEEERKRKEEPEMKMKWEYAECSNFPRFCKKILGLELNGRYIFKAKVIGGWVLRFYISQHVDMERLLWELNNGIERPYVYLDYLRGKWFVPDDSYVNGKFVGPWFYGGCIECVRWHYGFRYIANYDYPKIPPFICGDCGTCKACTDYHYSRVFAIERSEQC